MRVEYEQLELAIRLNNLSIVTPRLHKVKELLGRIVAQSCKLGVEYFADLCDFLWNFIGLTDVVCCKH